MLAATPLIAALIVTAPQLPTLPQASLPATRDTVVVAPVGPRATPADVQRAADVVVPNDTAPPRTDTLPVHRRRPVVIEYSDWYDRRLTLHRWASYTMIPMFAGQYFAGQVLLQKGSATPRWIISTHDALATGTAGLFGINTVTGLWNLWDSRNDPADRTRRWAHSLLMLTSDAGFTATGLLSNPAENSGRIRQLHKQIALTSMGVALLGYVIMLPPFRRD